MLLIIGLFSLCINNNASAQETSTEINKIKTAAEAGYAKAQYEWAVKCYEGYENIKSDRIEAVKWWLKSAEQGFVEAQITVASCYTEGIGVEKDYQKAKYWKLEAAKQGHPQAFIMLGEDYFMGRGVEKNPEMVFKSYELADKFGSVEGTFRLGQCYMFATGVERNLEEGIRLYKKAAEGGVKNAQTSLSLYYAVKENVDYNPQEAFKWALVAAKNNVTEMQIYAGYYHLIGFGTVADEKEGLKYLVPIAKANYEKISLKVTKLLVKYYTNKKNTVSAIPWIELAVEQGDETYVEDLVHIYYKEYVKNDEALAKWLKIGIANGSSYCEAIQGKILYDKGEKEEGLQLMKKAAADGDKTAKEMLKTI